jgi:hypothetical protein
MDERDAMATAADSGLLIDQLDTLAAQVVERRLEIPDADADVVESWAASLDEAVDRGPLASGLHQLDGDAAHVQRRLLDAVVHDVLTGYRVDPECARVEVERGIQVLDRDRNLIDPGDIHRISRSS